MTTKEASTVVSFVPGDLLYGAPAIAEYLGMTERQARHRIATGQLPSFSEIMRPALEVSLLDDHARLA